MVADAIYKISAFGDFLDIEPTPENMITMIKKFEAYGMIPSVVQELSLEVNYLDNTQKNEQLQRLSLVSKDNKERLLISSNRIDFEISDSDGKILSNENLNEHNEKVIYSFRTIFEEFNKKANRLAFNSSSFIVSINEEQIENILNKFSNPINIYKEKTLEGWSAYLVAIKNIQIGSPERANIITEIIQRMQIINNELNINSKGFRVNIDINTVPEETDLRFSSGSIRKFIDVSNDLKIKIIEDIKKAGNLT